MMYDVSSLEPLDAEGRHEIEMDVGSMFVVSSGLPGIEGGSKRRQSVSVQVSKNGYERRTVLFLRLDSFFQCFRLTVADDVRCFDTEVVVVVLVQFRHSEAGGHGW